MREFYSVLMLLSVFSTGHPAVLSTDTLQTLDFASLALLMNYENLLLK